MVDATVERAFFYPDPTGRVRLRVHVDQQCRNIGCRKTGGEIDGRSRLPNPTFLIGDCNDFSHMSISRRDEMKLDNITQITTSEILVKAREGVPRGTDGWRAGERGAREREKRLFSLSLALSFPRSPALPLSISPTLSVPRGTDEVHYISLIRTRNKQALHLLIMCERARLFFQALRPEDQNL